VGADGAAGGEGSDGEVETAEPVAVGGPSNGKAGGATPMAADGAPADGRAAEVDGARVPVPGETR
jgi:hypothetical protein